MPVIKKVINPLSIPIQSRPVRLNYHQLSQPSTTRGFKVQSGNIFPTKIKTWVPFFLSYCIVKTSQFWENHHFCSIYAHSWSSSFSSSVVFFRAACCNHFLLSTTLIVSELKSQRLWGTVFFIISTQQPVSSCPPQTVTSWWTGAELVVRKAVTGSC